MKTSLVLLSTLVLASAAEAQVSFTVLCPAGGFSATGSYQLNATGQITGQRSTPGSSVYSPFLWTPSTANGSVGTFVPLSTGGKANRAEVRGLNDLGDVVGSIYKPQGSGPLATFKHMAAVWPKGGAPVTVDGSVFQTEGEGINNAGDVAMYYNNSGSYRGSAVSRWVNGKRKTYLLGTGSGWPSDMNQPAQLVSYGGGQLWSPNASKTAWAMSLTGLGTSQAVNDQEVVVGSVPTSDGQNHPAFHAPDLGTYDLWNDLLVSLRSSASPWQTGNATGVSPSGLIVGQIDTNTGPDSDCEAWIRYTDGSIWGIPLPAGWSGLVPDDVNDARQVVGTARNLVDNVRYCVLIQL